MKKITLLVAVLIISCNNYEEEDLVVEFSKSNCTFVNSSRFLTTHCTFNSSHCNNNEPEFAFNLKRNILNEVNSLRILNQRPKNRVVVNSNVEFLDRVSGFTSINPNFNLYPVINPQESNEIYREITCTIYDEINNLPILQTNEYYVLIIDYLGVDFLWSTLANQTWITLYYDIEKWIY